MRIGRSQTVIPLSDADISRTSNSWNKQSKGTRQLARPSLLLNFVFQSLIMIIFYKAIIESSLQSLIMMIIELQDLITKIAE